MTNAIVEVTSQQRQRLEAGAVVVTTDHLGRRYGKFYVRKDDLVNPGWFVFGRQEGAEWRIMRVAHPHTTMTRIKVKGYTCYVTPGWRTKREALAWLMASSLAGEMARP